MVLYCECQSECMCPLGSHHTLGLWWEPAMTVYFSSHRAVRHSFSIFIGLEWSDHGSYKNRGKPCLQWAHIPVFRNHHINKKIRQNGLRAILKTSGENSDGDIWGDVCRDLYQTYFLLLDSKVGRILLPGFFRVISSQMECKHKWWKLLSGLTHRVLPRQCP